MAIRSGFFNSVNGDRKYDARRFTEYFASFIGNGVFPNPSTGLQVLSNNDMTVTVQAGKAWINGYILINDDDYVLEIEPADGVLNRIDRIVARYDVANREITLEVKQGDFATNAEPKNLQRDADAYELGLADIAVNAGIISITQANITDLRLNSELCGIVHGTVEQVDTTTLFNQYLDWYSTNTAQAEDDIANIKQQFEDDINQFLQDWQNWYAQTTDQAETDINDIIHQFQDNLAQFNQDWNDWFSNQQTEGFVMANEKGQPGGVATLDESGNVPAEQLGNVEIPEVPVTSVNGETGDVELAASDVGAETPAGAQSKADAAESNAKAYTDQEVGEIASELESHKAENATEAHDGISILNNNITVTVGDNGDFSTINDALNYLTTKYPAYKSGGNVTATIKLLSGFVMSEQVIVHGLDLGWIEIVGEDAETTIERSALTINFTIDDYGFDSFPAFGVSKGGTLPIIRQLFVMDNNGDRADRPGIMAVNNSRASILTGCGVQNAGTHGIYATRASIISANGANASNAGTYGIYAARASIISANNVNASNAGTHGIYATQASIISANGANASNAGTYGIYAGQASTIEAWGADASGAGEHGVYANQASIINAIAANARKGEVDSAEDIYVINGSIIKIAPTGNNQTIGGTNQDINTLTGNGIIFG